MYRFLFALAVCMVVALVVDALMQPSSPNLDAGTQALVAQPNPSPPRQSGIEVMATCPPGVSAKVVCLDANGRPAGSAGLCAALCVVGAGGVFTTPTNKEFHCRDVGTAKPADIVPYPDGSYLLRPSIPGQGVTVQCIK
jgi:hypothetical protein